MGPRSPETVHPLRRGRRRRISIPNYVRKFGCEEKIMEESSENDEEGVIDEKTADLEKRPPMRRIPTTTLEPQRTYNQEQSPLFSKLPPEIRHLIWRQCVGDYKIYLGVGKDDTGAGEKHIRHCKIFPGRGLMAPHANQDEQNELMAQSAFLSLLQSCRRIYTEAVAHVYTTNHFLMSTPLTVLSLSASTTLKSFASITKISIKYTPRLQHGLSFGISAHDMKIWRLTSSLLASMKNLRFLDLVFWDKSLYGTPADWENLSELLEMLGKVKVRPKGRYRVCLEMGGEVEGLREQLGETTFELSFARGEADDRLFWLA